MDEIQLVSRALPYPESGRFRALCSKKERWQLHSRSIVQLVRGYFLQGMSSMVADGCHSIFYENNAKNTAEKIQFNFLFQV